MYKQSFERPADRHQHPLISSTVVTVHFADVFTVSDLFGIGRRMGTERGSHRITSVAVSYTHLDNTFIFLRDLFGMSDASSVEDIYRSNLKLGIPENIFYTYIGSIYKDYNLLGTILFLFIFSTLVSFVLKSKQNGFSIVQIIILSIWMKILSVPTFYTYTTWIEQFNLLFVYLFCIYLYMLKFGRKTMFRYR